jgi:hypothetical protein
MSTDTTHLGEPDPIVERLEDQISFYDRESLTNQRMFKRTKLIEIMAAAMIPFLTFFRFAQVGWITGGLGVLIVVLEGMQHLNQYQQNWIAYRSTCESLKHEKYTFWGRAAPYADVANPHALLAERIESLVSQEHAKWVSASQQRAHQSEV